MSKNKAERELKFNEITVAILNKLEEIVKDKVKQKKANWSEGNKLTIELFSCDKENSTFKKLINEARNTYKTFEDKFKQVFSSTKIVKSTYSGIIFENEINKPESKVYEKSFNDELKKIDLIFVREAIDIIFDKPKMELGKNIISIEIPIPTDLNSFVVKYFGFKTKIKGLDRILGGKLMIPPYYPVSMAIAGRSGAGKSSLSLHLAASGASAGDLIIYFSLEQIPTDLTVLLQNYRISPNNNHFDYNLRVTDNTKDIVKAIRKTVDNKESEPDKGLVCIERIDRFNFTQLSDRIFNVIRQCSKEDIDLSIFKRKFIFIDSLNAVGDFDLHYPSWRDQCYSIIKFLEEKQFNCVFLMEKTLAEKDDYISYLTDCVIRLDFMESDNRRKGGITEPSSNMIRTIEVLKSRLQFFQMGKHPFYTVPGKGIKVYPSVPALQNLYPRRHRMVKDSTSTIAGGDEIKILGFNNFFREFHDRTRQMAPFWLKKSITLVAGEVGSHKSAFASLFHKSAFWDEKWSLKFSQDKDSDIFFSLANQLLEISILIDISCFNRVTIGAKLHDIINNSENVHSKIYYFFKHFDKKIKFFGLKKKENNNFSQIGKESKPIYIIQNDVQFIRNFIELIKRIKAFPEFDKKIDLKDDTDNYFKLLSLISNTINKDLLDSFGIENESQPKELALFIDHRMWKPDDNNICKALNYLNASPNEKCISLVINMGENYAYNPEKDITWETFFGRVHLPGCIKGVSKYGEISEIILDFRLSFYPAPVYLNIIEKLFSNASKWKTNKIIPNSYNEFVLNIDSRNNSLKTIRCFYEPFFTLKKDNYDFDSIDIINDEALENEINKKMEKLKELFPNDSLYETSDKTTKVQVIELLNKIINNGNLNINAISTELPDEHTIKYIEYIEQIYQDYSITKKALNKKINRKALEHLFSGLIKQSPIKEFDYSETKGFRISRVVLDDLDNIERQYPMVKVFEFLPVFCDLCAAFGSSLVIVATEILERPDETDKQVESLVDNVFIFSHFFYKGKDFNIMNIKRSSPNTHYRGVLEIDKNHKTGFLEARPSMKLLTNTTEGTPELLPIRFYLYEGEENYSRSELYGLYEHIFEKEVKDKKSLPLSESFDKAVIKLREPFSKDKNNEIEFEISKEERLIKRFNSYLIDSLKFDLAHEKIECHPNPMFFGNLDFKSGRVFAMDALSIAAIQDYRLPTHAPRFFPISYFLKFDNFKESCNSQQNKLDKENINLPIGPSEYYQESINKDSQGEFYVNSNILKFALQTEGNPLEYNYNGNDYEYREGNKFCDLLALPYYINPGVLLIDWTEISKAISIDPNIDQFDEFLKALYNNPWEYILTTINDINEHLRKDEEERKIKIEQIAYEEELKQKTIEKFFHFRHVSADDLCAFFFELLLEHHLLEIDDKKCPKDAIFCRDTIMEDEKRFFGFLIKFIKMCYFVDFDKQNPFENIVIFREWFSTATERMRILKRLQPEKDYRIIPLPGKAVSINMYLGVLKGSPRRGIGSEIVNYLCSPEVSGQLFTHGIGLPVHNDFYDDNNNETLRFQQLSSPIKDWKATCKKHLSLSKFACYPQVSTIFAGFLRGLMESVKKEIDKYGNKSENKFLDLLYSKEPEELFKELNKHDRLNKLVVRLKELFFSLENKMGQKCQLKSCGLWKDHCSKNKI